MNYSPTALGGAALVLLLLAGADARGDLIHWSYSWSRSPDKVTADNPGTGYIELSQENTLTPVAGNSDIVATNLRTYSQAQAGQPDTFTARRYTLSLYLLDQDSGDHGTLVFTGQFDGTLTAKSSSLRNTFTGDLVQSVPLGQNQYTVKLSTYSPPGPPNSDNRGSIGARAEITVNPIMVASLPEPSTLVLSGVGACFLGLARWRRRR